jgi:hypothetical protein
VSVGWSGLIWHSGNGAGGIFSPTSSILFGGPVPLFLRGCSCVARRQ